MEGTQGIGEHNSKWCLLKRLVNQTMLLVKRAEKYGRSERERGNGTRTMGLGDSTLVVHVFLHPSTYFLLVGFTGG